VFSRPRVKKAARHRAVAHPLESLLAGHPSGERRRPLGRRRPGRDPELVRRGERAQTFEASLFGSRLRSAPYRVDRSALGIWRRPLILRKRGVEPEEIVLAIELVVEPIRPLNELCVPVTDLAGKLGHLRKSMTLDVYVHVLVD
jgi:hypothetical protein